MVTIAFTVSFDSDVPATAQAVATRLTELFVHENRKDRAERVEGVPLFLATEARKLEERISELEDRLAVFKRENANTLPTMKESNLRGLDIAEREYATKRAEITALEERRDELVARMRQSTSGDSVLTQLRGGVGICPATVLGDSPGRCATETHDRRAGSWRYQGCGCGAA